MAISPFGVVSESWSVQALWPRTTEVQWRVASPIEGRLSVAAAEEPSPKLDSPSHVLRVLLIGGGSTDRRLISATVEGDDGAIVCDVVDGYRAGKAAILSDSYDACLVDRSFGAKTGIDLIRELGERTQVPLILLTGDGERAVGDEALAVGAADCLDKSRLTTDGIRMSIRYAIRLWNERSKYRQSSERRADFRVELLDQVNSSVIVTDNDGICTLWNRQAETMYGWSASEAVGRPITELTVFDHDAVVASEIMEQIASEGRWEGEFAVRRKDGSSFVAWVSNATVMDDRGAVVGVVGVSMDVTDHRQAESDLRRTQQLIGAAFEASPIGIVIATPDLAIVSCNPAYASFLGVPTADLIGRNVRDFTHPDDLEVATKTIARLTRREVDKDAYDRRLPPS